MCFRVKRDEWENFGGYLFFPVEKNPLIIIPHVRKAVSGLSSVPEVTIPGKSTKQTANSGLIENPEVEFPMGIKENKYGQECQSPDCVTA